MQCLIHSLSEPEQVALLEDLNYLNMVELKAFCNKHAIPYSIWIETTKRVRRKTRDDDRKGVMLHRIRHYLTTGELLDATCFPASVVCFADPPKVIKPTDRLFYGQYDKKSTAMIGLLEELTGGQFKNGAIARILARDFWSKGIAPTFQDYAAAWLQANENHRQPNPEWAFLSDRTKEKDTSNWKQLRAAKAKRVLDLLNTLEYSI